MSTQMLEPRSTCSLFFILPSALIQLIYYPLKITGTYLVQMSKNGIIIESEATLYALSAKFIKVVGLELLTMLQRRIVVKRL